MALTKLMTAEDLYLMGEDEGRFELIEGELREMSPASGDHGYIGLRIAARILSHAEEHNLGRAYNSDTGFVLARDPDLVLQPDASFVRTDQIPPADEHGRMLRLAPDLVVEVISPSERPSGISNKTVRYLHAGVLLVWVVYPDTQTVAVFRANHTWETVSPDGVLDGEDVLPGFKLELSTLFDF